MTNRPSIHSALTFGFEGADDSAGFKLTLADRVTNAHEMRMGIRRWSKMIVEALNVAKATRPPT
jgi:hypothetical protein